MLKYTLIQFFNMFLFSTYYFIFGLVMSWLIDFATPDHNPKRHKALLVIEVIIEMAITVYAAFLLMKIASNFPIVFINDIQKDERKKLKDELVSHVRGGIIIGFCIFLLQNNMKNKILVILGREDEYSS